MSDKKKCNCKEKLEAKLKERFETQTPEATEHTASLNPMYGCYKNDNELTYKPHADFSLTAKFPLKKGGFKERTTKNKVVFNYCPFCGVKV